MYTVPNYNDYCENKLPCGVCRLTGQMCPKHGFTPDWTYRPEFGPTCDAAGVDCSYLNHKDIKCTCSNLSNYDEENDIHYHNPVCKNKKRR